MVTKQNAFMLKKARCLNLAKIHMVTKRRNNVYERFSSLNLAKIHMVTKPQTYFNICI